MTKEQYSALVMLISAVGAMVSQAMVAQGGDDETVARKKGLIDDFQAAVVRAFGEAL